MYDGAFSFLLKCKQLYMMAMAPEERGRISATMAASDFYIFYNYTTRLCCHVSNYQKYTFDRICLNAIIYMMSKSENANVPSCDVYLYDISFPLVIYPLFPCSKPLACIMCRMPFPMRQKNKQSEKYHLPALSVIHLKLLAFYWLMHIVRHKNHMLVVGQYFYAVLNWYNRNGLQLE